MPARNRGRSGPCRRSSTLAPWIVLGGFRQGESRLGTRDGAETPWVAAWPSWPASETNQHRECTRLQRQGLHDASTGGAARGRETAPAPPCARNIVTIVSSMSRRNVQKPLSWCLHVCTGDP